MVSRNSRVIAKAITINTIIFRSLQQGQIIRTEEFFVVRTEQM